MIWSSKAGAFHWFSGCLGYHQIGDLFSTIKVLKQISDAKWCICRSIVSILKQVKLTIRKEFKKQFILANFNFEAFRFKSIRAKSEYMLVNINEMKSQVIKWEINTMKWLIYPQISLNMNLVICQPPLLKFSSSNINEGNF